MAEKDGTERRVYNLPADLLERLRAFQLSQGIASEAEAARRLLDSALQMRDSIETILETLKARYVEERDIRVIAGDVLAKHALVKSIEIDDDEIVFTMRSGDKGRLVSNGALYHQSPDENYDNWSSYARADKNLKKPKAASNGWDAPSGGDLDDEIPF